MILGLDDIIDEVCAEYPKLDRASIEKICKKGLYGMKRLLGNGDELIVTLNKEITTKFFIPMTPEQQRERTLYRAAVRRNKENERKNAEQV